MAMFGRRQREKGGHETQETGTKSRRYAIWYGPVDERGVHHVLEFSRCLRASNSTSIYVTFGPD